jgi:hypothetical protein
MLGVKSILFILGQFKPNLDCIICIIHGTFERHKFRFIKAQAIRVTI